MKQYEWLEKRTPRSVDELRLWSANPRLNPEEEHIYLTDYAQDLLSDEGERESFLNLLKSISTMGFIPADPIIVWKNPSNEKFYVAEGNRRVLALKLLRDPKRSPMEIRSYVRKYSQKIDKTSIQKILVCVAPSLEEAEWYINQRHNAASLQKNWSRIQQQRWIASLYEKYKDDIDKMIAITSMSKADIEQQIRILKIKDYIKLEEVRSLLTNEEYEKANSHRFSITILERFISYADVKTRWGITYDGPNVILNANLESFYKAFAELIKRIVNEEINTRMKAEDAPHILDSLPQVILEEKGVNISATEENNIQQSTVIQEEAPNDTPSITQPKPMKNDPNRSRLILDIYTLHTTDTKLKNIFDELKHIPLKYTNAISASIRIFLDIAIRDFIIAEGIDSDLCKFYKCNLKEIPLQKRLTYLKDNKLKGDAKNIVEKLLNTSNEFSLDVLNGYVHSSSTAYLSKQFLNRFWDFLFPLFEVLLDIKEIQE